VSEYDISYLAFLNIIDCIEVNKNYLLKLSKNLSAHQIDSQTENHGRSQILDI
jgi:hypothetical protein